MAEVYKLETANEKIERLEGIIEHYEDGQVWYVDALDKLRTLRYDLGQVLERGFKSRDHPDFITITLSKEEFDGYKKDQKDVNDYFSLGKKK